ncbi:hypothetical protein HY411_00910 [Candidatus Gottesmanbacteria bacterium]|nr:hypothetical protein [Candidatus Gottesmanbacteria bacterium]
MKKLLVILTSVFLLIAVPATAYFLGQQQDIRKKAAPATTLALSPASVTKKVDDVFSLEVIIDTGENQVVAAELHVVLDQTKLEAQTITNGPLFPNILTSGTIEQGTASITVGVADAKQPVRGTGTVAVIRLKALAKTDSPTSIKLASNTFVGGLGEGAINVLVGTTPATATITEQQAPSTPSPSPILTPKSSPAPQASGSGLTPSLTPTPTSTDSAQASPSAAPAVNLAIISPTQDTTATGDKPVIRGTAAPGATITLTIYSTPRTVTVTADASGNWAYTPDTALESGPHNIVASVTNQSGQTQTATSAFIIATSGRQAGSSATESAIPVSGTIEVTILFILIGSVFVVMGIFLPSFALKSDT